MLSPGIALQAGLAARFGGFLPLSVTEGFDLALFGLSGGEAELMDPQQRLLLEVSLEVSTQGCKPDAFSPSSC